MSFFCLNGLAGGASPCGPRFFCPGSLLLSGRGGCASWCSCRLGERGVSGMRDERVAAPACQRACAAFRHAASELGVSALSVAHPSGVRARRFARMRRQAQNGCGGVHKSACARFYPFFRLAASKAMLCVMVNKKWTTGRRFIWPRTLVFGKAMRTGRWRFTQGAVSREIRPISLL